MSWRSIHSARRRLLGSKVDAIWTVRRAPDRVVRCTSFDLISWRPTSSCKAPSCPTTTTTRATMDTRDTGVDDVQSRMSSFPDEGEVAYSPAWRLSWVRSNPANPRWRSAVGLADLRWPRTVDAPAVSPRPKAAQRSLTPWRICSQDSRRFSGVPGTSSPKDQESEGRDMTAQDVCVKKKKYATQKKRQTNHFYRGKKLR